MVTREFQGDPFAGDSKKERKVGKESLVTCDLFRRRNDTYFMRVSLRSLMKPKVISRYEVDLDRYISESDFLKAVAIAAGALAEKQNQEYGDPHEPADCARAGAEAAKEILHEINN